jgi:hypothetical protein
MVAVGDCGETVERKNVNEVRRQQETGYSRHVAAVEKIYTTESSNSTPKNRNLSCREAGVAAVEPHQKG